MVELNLKGDFSNFIPLEKSDEALDKRATMSLCRVKSNFSGISAT
jgi:hypothetical protein